MNNLLRALVLLVGFPSVVTAQAPASRWKLDLAKGASVQLRVDPARGRIAVADGGRVRLLDRSGRVLTSQSLPLALGSRIEVLELGPGGLLFGGARAVMLVRESGAPIVVALPDGRPVGAAPAPDGGFRICLASEGGGAIVAVDAEGKRRWTARTDLGLTRCAPASLSEDGALWASGARGVVSVDAQGQPRARSELPSAIERAPVAWSHGALVQTEAGLVGLAVGGGRFVVAEADDGVIADGGRAIVLAGRRLAFIDPKGIVRERSTPLSPALDDGGQASRLDEQPPQLVAGIIATPVGKALVLVGRDGRERFRIGLPRAEAALLLGRGELLVVQDGALELLALPEGVLDEPRAAARAVAADPAMDAWAKLSATARTGVASASPEIVQLTRQLVALYPAQSAGVIETLGELGAIAAPAALALLERGPAAGDGPTLARLVGDGEDSLRGPLEALLERPQAPVAAAQALALLAGKASSAAPYQAALLRVIVGPQPRFECNGALDENAALGAVVEVLAHLGPSINEPVGRALADPTLSACRAHALKTLLARTAPPAITLDRLRAQAASGARVDLDEVRLAEGLGAAAVPVFAEAVSNRALTGDSALAIVEALGRMKALPTARAVLLDLVAGRIPVPPAARSSAIRAVGGETAGDVAAALTLALRQALAQPDGAVRAEEALRALGAVAPEAAASLALELATDPSREASLRLWALKVVARRPVAEMRPALERLGEAGGPTGEAAMRALLPHVGMRLDEQRRVTQVTPASSADRAGLRPSDRVIGVAGEPIETLVALEQRMSTWRVGDAIALRLERAAATLEVTLIVGSALELEAD